MSSLEKIGKIEAIALFITVISTNIIINLPSALIDFAGTGAWLNLIYVTILVFIFTIIICKMFKAFPNSDILDISEYIGKKNLKTLIGFFYIIFFIFLCAMYLRYFSNSLQIVYFNDTPLVFLLILLLIPPVIAGRYGLKAISGANLIFVPITVFAIITLFITASTDFTWQHLFPVLGYGAKETFITGTSNIAFFVTVSYIFFLKPLLKDEDSFKKISLISVIICGLYLLLSVLALLMTFSFIVQTDENISLHMLTRIVSFGNFVQRVDAIFIFIWSLSSLSFLSFTLLLISHIFRKVCNLKSPFELVYPFAGLIFASSLAFKDIAFLKYFFRNLYKIFFILLVFILSFIILFCGYIKKKKKEHGMYES